MKAESKAKLQHLTIVGVMLVLSVYVTCASCPFGTDSGDALLFMLGWVVASHVLAAGISVFLRKFSWGSSLVIGLICFLPASVFPGFAIKDSIYLRYFAVGDRFRDDLANPMPKSVRNLRFNPLSESLNPDLSFQFDIDPKNLQDIIKNRGLKRVVPEGLLCPQDYFKYPHYLPVTGKFILYQGIDKNGDVLTLKVTETHDHAVFRKESESYYRHRLWDSNPALKEMAQEGLDRLKRKYASEPEADTSSR